MCSKYILLVLTCVIIFYTSYAQILTCTYRIHNTYGYTCDIFIYNPSGTYNFSRISGTHLAGKTNEDVRYILRTSNTNTTNVPYIICETFQNATRFELQSIRIKRIDENSFWGCKSLKYLDLSNNLLTSLPVNAFSTHPSSYTNQINELPWDKYDSHLQSLETLHLYSNQIQEILPYTFDSLASLITLNLYSNQIEKIYSNAFNSLSSLTTLNLYSSKIEEIFPNAFNSLTSLTTLRLDLNQIEEILPLTFNSLVNLKTLRLENNKIIKLNANSFESMEKLTSLQLENNQIEEIPPGTFSSLNSLPTLRLFNNRITKMVPESFESLENVTIVYLYNNKIEEIPPKVFSFMISLKVLDLSYNNLSKVFPGSFDSLETLTTLNLHYNQIEELPRNAFSSLKQLPTIHLYNNKLKVIHSFGVLPNLKTVNIYNNQIDAFDQDLIDDTGVTTIDIRNNICANVNITDTSSLRLQMRMKLLNCFENYGNLLPETTTVPTTTSLTSELSTTDYTSSSPGCVGGNIDERVCRIEDKNEEMYEHFNDQFLELQTTLENKSKAFAAALEELESKIEELTNRPCACG